MPASSPLDPRTLDALRGFDTPTICNAIERLGVRPPHEGYLDGSIRALFPEMPAIVGFASTATFRSARPREEDEVATPLWEQVARQVEEVPAPRIVVFEDLDDPPAGATFGEVMGATYQAFGAEGIITSGGARDLDPIRERGFACFAREVTPSHAHCRIVEVHVPVRVGGCEIRPGDLLHADENGVTTIPVDRAHDVIRLAGAIIASEKAIFDLLEMASPPDPDGLREALEAHHRRLEAMRGGE